MNDRPATRRDKMIRETELVLEWNLNRGTPIFGRSVVPEPPQARSFAGCQRESMVKVSAERPADVAVNCDVAGFESERITAMQRPWKVFRWSALSVS